MSSSSSMAFSKMLSRQRSQLARRFRCYTTLRDLSASLPPSFQKPRLKPLPLAESTPESSQMALQRSQSLHQMSSWTSPPRRVLLVQKQEDRRTADAMAKLLAYLRESHPELTLLAEAQTINDNPSLPLIPVSNADSPTLANYVDLVITLGGDGTVLHTSQLFGGGECPPVLCFSLGSLGFLLPFHIDHMESAISSALTGPVSVLNRMRLSCTPLDAEGQRLKTFKPVPEHGWQVMNEVTLHRGHTPHLAVVDAFFDGAHLTEAVADGLLLSTPTGSTAYSLSAGGPISHPETDAFLLTPIAPRSLSFRTVILPGRGTVQLQISPLARTSAELSVDGRKVCELKRGESVVIQKSAFPIPCIERSDGGSGWVTDINSLLQFNVGFRNKSLFPGGP